MKKSIIIGKHINLDDKNTLDYAVNKYADFFYKGLVKYADFLSTSDLKKYAILFTKDVCVKYQNVDYDIRVLILNTIKRELIMYDKNLETLFKRYVMLVGIDDDTLNFFMNKYSYLLDRYKNTGVYDVINDNYKLIVKESLLQIYLLRQSVLRILKNNLYHFYLNAKKNKNDEIKKREFDEEKIEKLYSDYSYIKELFFNKFKAKVTISDDVLKKLIDSRFELYFNAYINGVSKSEIDRYIYIRLEEYLKKLTYSQDIGPDNITYSDGEVAKKRSKNNEHK